MISDTKVFIVAIAFRTLTAFLIQTWFVPDEIFQVYLNLLLPISGIVVDLPGTGGGTLVYYFVEK
jgi:hypothetical protein